MTDPARLTDPDALLTKDDAMAYLSVSLRTLNRLIKDRELDVVRVGPRGGAVRFRRAALADYAHRHTDRATANARRGGTK